MFFLAFLNVTIFKKIINKSTFHSFWYLFLLFLSFFLVSAAVWSYSWSWSNCYNLKFIWLYRFSFNCYNLLVQQEEEDEVMRMRDTPDFFNKLVESICPTVFGHQEIKRAVLLMLLGGVHKITHEGINLRGDINLCIVGDPSCAKSQFLKYVWWNYLFYSLTFQSIKLHFQVQNIYMHAW